MVRYMYVFIVYIVCLINMFCPLLYVLLILLRINKYFSSIGLNTSQNVPVTNMKFTDYLPNRTRHSMFLEPVTSLLITNTTAKLKPKSCSGHDEISTKLLK